MLNENDAALDLCLTQWAEDSAGELRSVLLAAQARLRELARGGECEPAGASGRIDDIELPIRPSVLGGPAVEAWENRKEDGHSQAEEQRRRIAKGLVVPSGVSVEELCRRLTAVSHCRRCECLDCSNGYENHSHYCTHGKNCVETPQRWSAWMFGVAKTTNEAATLIRSLRMELDEAQEERDIWRSVFPDIAPESVVPNRSLLEARVTTAEAEAERLRAALEPFASFAEYMDGNWPRGSWMQVEWPGNKYDYQYNSDGSTIPDDFIVIQAVREFVAANQQTLIFMEHFRRARAALKGKTDGK